MSNRNLAGLLLLAFSSLPATSAHAEVHPAEQILRAYSQTLVKVQYVLRLKENDAGAGLFGLAQDTPGTVTGLIIDPRGIAVCSNAELFNYVGLMSRYMGLGSAPSAVPTQIEVTVPGHEEPYPARLLAVDEDLDLAWIRIEDPGGGVFDHLDLRRGALPQIGESFYLLRRADEAFGRVPMLLAGQIGGITDTPRRLYLPAAPVGHVFGSPVWTAAGELLGLTTLQLPAPDRSETITNTLEMMSQTARLREQATAVVLPAKVVEQATQRALQLADPTSDPASPDPDTARRTP